MVAGLVPAPRSVRTSCSRSPDTSVLLGEHGQKHTSISQVHPAGPCALGQAGPIEIMSRTMLSCPQGLRLAEWEPDPAPQVSRMSLRSGWWWGREGLTHPEPKSPGCWGDGNQAGEAQGPALVEQWAGCEGDRPGWQEQPGGDRQGGEGPTLTSRECRAWFLFTQDRKRASLIPDAAEGVRKQQGLSTGVPQTDMVWEETTYKDGHPV